MEQFFTDYLALLQDLNGKFVAAFDGLPDSALDWVPGTDMNTLAALVVHTIGSARFWIGDVALGEDSHRDRDAEFKARGLSSADLKARFAAVEAYVQGALARLTLADLATARTATNRPAPVTVGWALQHALEHTALHLGHAQITRQLWDSQAK